MVLSAWRQHPGTAMELASLSSVNSSHSSAALRCESMMVFNEPQHAHKGVLGLSVAGYRLPGTALRPHDPHRGVWSNASRSGEYSARAFKRRRRGEAANEACDPRLPRPTQQGLLVMLATQTASNRALKHQCGDGEVGFLVPVQ